MEEGVGRPDGRVFEALLADVGSVPIDELVKSGNAVLARSIQQVVDDLERSDDAISGWQSFID